jgi:hypothetical protein
MLKIKNNLVLIIALGLILIDLESAFSQSYSVFNKAVYDTSYIKKFKERLTARLYTVSKSQHFTVKDREANLEASFDPNTTASLGIGVSYGNLALDLGINIKSKKTDPQYETNSFDFLSAISSDQYIFDLNIQLYTGFFSKTTIPFIDSAVNIFRGDIRTFNFGVDYLYNFNSKKYSFNAAFLGLQEQRKRAGAPLAGVFISYFDLRSDSSIVPKEVEQTFDPDGQISEANLLTTGLLGGYAYTFVLPHHFYLSLSLIPGISFSAGDVKSELYYHIGYPLSVSPKVVSKNALGYCGKKIYGVFSLTIDQNFVNMGYQNSFIYNASKLKLVIGYRI